MSNEVEIKLNSAQFIKGLKNMKSEVKGFGVAAGKLAVLGVIMKTVADGFKMAFTEINKMNNAARGAGVTIGTMQSLSVAAQKVGGDTSTAAGAIKQLSDGIIAAQDGTGKFAAVFRRLGLDAEYMANLSTDQQMYVLADAIQSADEATREWSLARLGGEIEALGPVLEKGTQGIMDFNAGTLKVSQETADNIAKAKGYWIDLKTVIISAYGAIIGFVIQKTKGWADAYGQLVLSLGDLWLDLGVVIKHSMVGNLIGAAKASNRMKDNMVKNAKLIGAAYIDAFKDTEPPAEDSDRTVADIERDEKSRENAEKNAGKSEKDRAKAADDLAKKEAKLAETKNKNSEIGLKPDELRAKLIKDEEAQVEKINKMRGDALDPGQFGMGAGISDAEKGAILDEQDKLEKIKGRIAKIDDDAGKNRLKLIGEAASASADFLKDEQDKIDKAKKADDKANEDALKTEAQIAAERDKRSEIGMSDADLAVKALGEEKNLEGELTDLNIKANEDGVITGEERKGVAEKELELAKKRSELAGMVEGLQPDDSAATVIASSLAAIGGGGGVASFSSDPLLNENKRQSNILQAILKQLGGTEDGGTTFNPEL